MALPTNRTTFSEYCLRKLGKGAIDINVTEDQIQDRIDEAIEHFSEYHDEGTEHIFLKYQLTESDMVNSYITMPNNIIGVSGFLPYSGTSGGDAIFNVDYQYWFNNVDDITGGETQYYYVAMQHLQHIENMFDYLTPIRYNRVTNKVYIDDNLHEKFNAGDYMVFESWAIIDESMNTRFWQNKWLRDYTTALIKKQWGENLAKYDGVQMIGGTTFNAQRLIDEANNDIEKLEEQVKVTETAPMGVFIG